ncbi:MAG: hypothetical protein RBU21_14670, partial [FCB group bacterium]|nr:hypothetical protein [FCB group bacterium]
SGRADWQRRVLFFGLFGGIGWGFGGSMAYMQVVSYTASGHLPSQIYGFFGVFTMGFLWASLGGAGTAYPAVETRERLTALLKPMTCVFALWGVFYFIEGHIDTWYGYMMAGPADSDRNWYRQNSPFYWLDSDWIQATLAIAGCCLFDLWDRWVSREDHGPRWVGEAFVLVLLPIFGALAGWAIQAYLTTTGLIDYILPYVVQPLGDLHAPVLGEDGKLLHLTADHFLYNWPQLFFDFAPWLGALFGAVAGIALYFAVFGRWRSGSSLLMHMSLGWFAGFLVMPVLLTPYFLDYGGFRMTPPRGDNWAGLVGVVLGVMLYMWRNRLVAVNLALLVSGIVGGLGFMFAQFMKMMLMAIGHPVLFEDPATRTFWSHWKSTNWHSLMTEQFLGLFYGLGIVVSLALLSKRTPRLSDDPPVRRWAEVYAAAFILVVLAYVNIVKNVDNFIEERTPNIPGVTATVTNPAAFEADRIEDADRKADDPVPAYRLMPGQMRMPLIESINLSAWSWFSILFLLFGLCVIALGMAHLSKPLAIVPASWVGRGQLVYLAFLWAMVIANFERALPGFTGQRLVTEGLIFVNAVIATFLLVYYLRDGEPSIDPVPARYWPLFAKTVLLGMVALLLSAAVYTAGARAVYGDRQTAKNRRFGDQADWYVKPILRNQRHR